MKLLQPAPLRNLFVQYLVGGIPMVSTSTFLIGVLPWALGGLGQAADGPKVIAAGEWSKPVADAGGYAVRGRLVLCEKPVRDDRREVAVYVELQDASAFVGGSRWLFCDFGKTDFRPEYKGGLQCELRDKDRRQVKSSPVAFSGAVPKSQWVMLPSDATIRLRASPFGIHRAKALALAPDLGKLWVIGDGDPNEYFLSGTFTVDPAAGRIPPGKGHVWCGTIELPAVRIVNRRKAAAAADSIDRLIARLSSSHGLWRNGLFPRLDLPATASTEQVIARVFQRTGIDKGRVSKSRNVQIRQVRIPGSLPDEYTAVLVETDLGRKIVLLQRVSGSLGWWSRVYDAEQGK
jgi:hypothetical protein